jgi:hypothetical protein
MASLSPGIVALTPEGKITAIPNSIAIANVATGIILFFSILPSPKINDLR